MQSATCKQLSTASLVNGILAGDTLAGGPLVEARDSRSNTDKL